MDVRLATSADIPSLMALESRNFVGNLDASERRGGFISVLHTREWFDRAVAYEGVHVAVEEDGAVMGFIVVMPPPSRSEAEATPILAAMLDLAEAVEFRGAPIAAQRYAFRGPVLIDRAARGRGLYTAFNAVTREAYRDRFNLAVLFVAADNPRSLHTTTTKLGATPLASFEVEGSTYHFLAVTY
jgi:hypothetical protein